MSRLSRVIIQTHIIIITAFYYNNRIQAAMIWLSVFLYAGMRLNGRRHVTCSLIAQKCY